MNDPCLILNDSEKYLSNTNNRFDLTFMDPPFNQNKEYRSHQDNMEAEHYWEWLKRICARIYERTSPGGAIYFMQREKNAHRVMEALDSSGWTFQNMIVWKKKTSAVPETFRFGKHYQVIVFATKGKKPRVFNKLRIDPPLLVTEKYARPNGMYVTVVWDDIRELTSGYFAGDEPLRFPDGKRVHNQQSPIALLLRIILSSSKVGDMVFDPFAGTATTLVVAYQLQRHSIGIELDPVNVEFSRKRLLNIRPSDLITRYLNEYRYTENLLDLWPKIDPENYTLIKSTAYQAALLEKEGDYKIDEE